MSLIAAGTGQLPEDTPSLANNGFWPDIKPADFREATRLDGTVTAPRLVQALQIAMADINRQLSEWQQARQNDGAATLDDVTSPDWAGPDHYAVLYRRAVYATAHASLLERYRDVSATMKATSAVTPRTWPPMTYAGMPVGAVAEIEGRHHTTVELI
ncbi:phage head completion protein (GPL) [Halolamina pelagica]|uniref:Phage head completion protein (GPL) n=1 Tax=Halolamina pelagica TaxID=699431 RepID=A0A0P7GTU2_9EURY|nr:head completion/stabilization protein [Halolamina pelagica]KPN28870.1 phage head completion protein (GPL) [Halolamina pelagica]